MRNLIQIAGLILAFCRCVFAQSPDTSLCPTISVDGPSGVPQEGQPMHFMARVDAKGKELRLEYHWFVDYRGTIIKGQGTSEIDVLPVFSGITATVEVIGFPSGCAISASEMVTWEPRPEATKLDELVGSLSRISKRRFAKIIEFAKTQPNSQVFILMSGDSHNRVISLKRKRKLLIESIVSKLGEDSRVTFVDSTKNDDRVAIWLVPPGADLPMIYDK